MRQDHQGKRERDRQKASQEERNHWRLIGGGHGIHWEEIDEDISVEGLLAGRASSESQASLKKWLEQRKMDLTMH